MDFGVNFAPGADTWKLVKRAEELGFSHAWFLDSQLLNADLFVVMAACAMQTTKIELGSAMLIPSNRIAPVTANALASLNKLAPGRINLGIATGFTARRAMGVGPLKLSELETHIRVVTGLLAGETVAFPYEGADRQIRFLSPELELINLKDPIDLFVSALGPKGRRMVARLGAAWTTPFGAIEPAIAALGDMQAAWREAGRDGATLYAVAQGGGCVLAEAEAYDSARAIDQAGPSAVMLLHDAVEGASNAELSRHLPKEMIEGYRAVYESYTPADARYLSSHKGHLMIVRPEESRFVTADLVRRMSFTGTVADLRQRIRALRDAGFKQFTTHVRYGQPEMLEDWARVVEGV